MQLLDVLWWIGEPLFKATSLTLIAWSLAVILGGVTDDAENQILPLFAGLLIGVLVF